MAKKKNQSKKHRFKYSEPESSAVMNAPVSVESSGSDEQSSRPSRSPVSVAAAGARSFTYVAGDLRRIGVFAVVLTLLQVALWLLFTHTGVGPAVYNLVQV